MGLQRLFSAMTAVVGLFISVDYGLCDEFRCRGSNIKTNAAPTVGWQGRAMWTLIYVAGIALWTLHLSLLEGHVVFAENVNISCDFVSTVHFLWKLMNFAFTESASDQLQEFLEHRFSNRVQHRNCTTRTTKDQEEQTQSFAYGCLDPCSLVGRHHLARLDRHHSRHRIGK